VTLPAVCIGFFSHYDKINASFVADGQNEINIQTDEMMGENNAVG